MNFNCVTGKELFPEYTVVLISGIRELLPLPLRFVMLIGLILRSRCTPRSRTIHARWLAIHDTFPRSTPVMVLRGSHDISFMTFWSRGPVLTWKSVYLPSHLIWELSLSQDCSGKDGRRCNGYSRQRLNKPLLGDNSTNRLLFHGK